MKPWFISMGLAAAIGGSAAVANAQTQGHPGDAAQAGDTGQSDKGSLAEEDEQFVKEAYSINKGEMMLGKLAEERGTTQQVKDFGKRMVGDHSLALQELEQVAHAHGIALPTQLQQAQQSTYDALSKLHGTAFDEAYLTHMKTGHLKAIKEFASEAQSGKDTALRDYAEKQLPMLHAHEQIITHDIQVGPGPH